MIIDHSSSKPFTHQIIDGFLSGKELAQIDQEWPQPDWQGWIDYDPRYEGKRASDLRTALPSACTRAILRIAREITLIGGSDCIADLSLYGAGLHEMAPGQHLGLHLDAARHGRLRELRRIASAVLYVSPRWVSPGWGGALELWDAQRTRVVSSIAPEPGRLVVFSTLPHEQTYHAVEPVSSSAPITRRSLSLFFYDHHQVKGDEESTTTTRATFVQPAYAPSDGLEAVRKLRGM